MGFSRGCGCGFIRGVRRLSEYLAVLADRCASLPDKRSGRNTRYPMRDIGLAAFSVFFMQYPSFLAHQRLLTAERGRSNAQTLFGMAGVPCDNHIRRMLDGAPPEHFDAVFSHIINELDATGGLSAMRCLDGRTLIALDGSEHFRSRKVHCAQCSMRRRDGAVEYFHGFVGASIVAPGQRRALPLAPEFVRPQDGAAKQDCESRAARRWLARLGPSLAGLRPVYLGDDLYSRQPICEAVRAVGGSFLFVCKPASHKTLSEYRHGVALDETRETRGRGPARRIYRYRWMTDVPLRDGADALCVNWLEVEIARPDGKVTYRNSFVTDLPVTRENVATLAACGRARWKVENETFNVLKTNGYNLEHNFGHGRQTLASVLVVLNLLAFAMHTANDLIEAAWRKARRALGTRMRFFEHLRTVTAYHVFPSWAILMTTLVTGRPPPATS